MGDFERTKNINKELIKNVGSSKVQIYSKPQMRANSGNYNYY